MKLFSLRNYLGIATHYGLIGAVAAGAFLFAQPWAIMLAVGLAVPATGVAIWQGKKYLENFLVEHPKKHPHSPLLGHIAKELYQASGLKSKNYPIYDFQIKDGLESDEDGKLGKMFQTMGQTPNAAAMNLGKPVIMISQPLLKLLDNKEEKAVLAHEFAHATARHQHLRLPLALTASTARLAASLTVIGAAIGTGLWVFAGSILAGMVARKIALNLHPARPLFDVPAPLLGLREMHDRKKAEKLATVFASAAAIGTLAVYNPAYPLLWATSRAIGVSSGFLSASFSRANEYQADRGAVVLGADPLALITSLRKITALTARSKQAAWDEGNWDNREMPKPGFLSTVWARAMATHPTLHQRTERLAALAREQGRSEEEIDSALHSPIDISKADNIPYETIKFLAARLL